MQPRAPGFSLGEELGVGILVFSMCSIWFPNRERLRLFNIGNLQSVILNSNSGDEPIKEASTQNTNLNFGCSHKTN